MSVMMQEAPSPRVVAVVIPRIICTRPSLCEDDDTNNNNDVKTRTRQRKIARSRVRRNSRRLSCRSSSSSRSPSPQITRNHHHHHNHHRKNSALSVSGYKQYLELLQVPSAATCNLEFGEASDNDLSSEWDSDQSSRNDKDQSSLANVACDASETTNNDVVKVSGWRKLRNFVHWTPFFQTYKKQRYPWVQLAGHQGNFRAGPMPGTALNKLCPQEEECFRLLMNDVLRPFVPEYKGVLDVRENDVTEERKENDQNNVQSSAENDCPNDKMSENKGAIVASYLQLQDLLGEFEQPCVMDCKVGVRTYLESELAKAKERPKLRKDMYEKMVQIDPNAPSDEERRLQGVTKPRYMVWRETISSTATLGFRVEGMKLPKGGSTKDFKTTRTREQVMQAMQRFVEDYPHAPAKYLQRLKSIRATLKASPFFATHEMVGSSLLFVHDAKNAGVWMIDFAKTLPLPQSLPLIRHDTEWQVGNHEDGYLIGVNNLIDIFEEINASLEQTTVS